MLNLIVDFGPGHKVGAQIFELVLNVEVGYGENSSVDNEDRKDKDESVFPFVGRER